MTRLRGYWGWLGRRLRLSQPGRVLFSAVLVLGVTVMAVTRAQGDREGGAPVLMLLLFLAGVVCLDAIGRSAVGVVRRLTRG